MENVPTFYGHLVFYGHFVFYSHLVYFVFIWYFYCRFGRLYEQKSGIPFSVQITDNKTYLLGTWVRMHGQSEMLASDKVYIGTYIFTIYVEMITVG
jgi:hypothetical protein